MDTICCQTSFGSTHDRLTEFIGICRHVTCCIETLYGCLLALVDDEASFAILLWRHRVDDLRKWCRSYGDEYSIERKDLIIL